MAHAARHPEHVAHLVILDSAAPRWQDTRFLFADVYPEIDEKRNSRGFAETLGDAEAVAANLHDYMSMLFVSPEKRDAFLAAAPSFTYRRTVNETLNADLARFDLFEEPEAFQRALEDFLAGR